MTDPIKELFRRHRNLSKKELDEANISTRELTAIYENYIVVRPSYEEAIEYAQKSLQRASRVHSVRVRTKDPISLLEKIVRKRRADPERLITVENYLDQITDLAGVRVLHLYKEDWLSIHKWIMDKWDRKEEPVANVRKGDSPQLAKSYKENGLVVNERDHGYRSIHYLIQTRLSREPTTVEVQVRTIFEEAWSEIDHEIRYPSHEVDDVLVAFLLMFNRAVGNADEMASYV